MLSIVIFYHPGGEHHVSPAMLKKGIMPWSNLPGHHRKFLEAKGDSIQNGVLSSQLTQLRFWGEWEPDSYVQELSIGSSPRFLHTPFLRDPLPNLPSYASNACGTKPACGTEPMCGAQAVTQNRLQNTDPFVFGDSFLYSNCQQITKKGKPTGMTQLEIGSIILFGSRVNGNFALDTVFVVGDKKPYTPQNMSNDLAGFVPSDYPQIMQLSGTQKYVCYKGATYSNHCNGMYSFVPCKISNGKNVGFSRAVLTPADFQSCNMSHILSDRQTQGRKITEVNGHEAKQVWDSVRLAILKQNFLEGFNFQW